MSSGGWDRDGQGRYTTVTQYRIPRDDDRGSSFQEERRPARASETRIVRRENSSPSRVERDIRIERYERSPDPRRGEREYRSKGRPEDYQLDRYIRTTEYYPPRAPIVVPREEEDYQLVRRADYEDQQIARRDPGTKEEDYYYKRRVREIDDGEKSRRGSRSPERRKKRSSSRQYSSDDDMVYVKRETTEGRSGDAKHRRHLLEGAAAGAGVAELLRHHRVRKGEDPGTTKGRIGRDLGAAAAGALSAEVVSRAKSAYRSRSQAARSRAGSEEDREGRRRRRHSESRSRSRSKSRVKTLAGIGIGVAALAAAAGYAKHRHDQQKIPEDQRESRSRTRRASTGGDIDSKKNRTIAGAGLAGAAVAGLIEKARSKSRTRDGRSRSHNRLKTGLPIAAAGLGSAAIAGLYEARKEKKAEQQREVDAAENTKRRSESRSRSRHRSDSAFDGPPMASHSTPGLIEYGSAPVSTYPGNPQEYYRQQPQYEYALPAAGGAAAGYGASRAAEAYSPRGYSPTRDRGRRDSSVDSSDGDARRRRHRRRKSNAAGSRERSASRARELATAGLAAGAAAFGMNEYNKRREKKKAAESEARERAEAEQQAAYDPNSPSYSQFSPMSPPQPIEQGYAPENYYPHTDQFAPPPGGYQPSPQHANYHPAEYATAPHASRDANEYYQAHQGYSPTHEPYSPTPPPVGANYAPAGAHRGEENVSPGHAPDPRLAEEGLRGRDETPRPGDRHRRSKSVQFAPGEESPNGHSSPDDRRHRRRRRAREYSDSEEDSGPEQQDKRHRSGRQDRDRDREHPKRRAASPAHSDSTIDLPERFDRDGRPKNHQQRGGGGGGDKEDDSIAGKIEDLLAGKTTPGKLFKGLAENFLGGGGGGGGGGSSSRDRR